MFVKSSGSQLDDRLYLAAALKGDVPLVLSSLKDGADPYATVQEGRVDRGIVTAVNCVVALSDMYYRQSSRRLVINHETALHIAARAGKVKVVEELLQRYPRLKEIADSFQRNALFKAHSDCIPTLLEHGIDVLQKDIHGQTPLYSMIDTTNAVGAKLIIEHMNKTSPPVEHALIHSVLKQPNIYIPKDVINIVNEYFGYLNEKDICIPKRFLKHIPGKEEYVAQESGLSIIEKTWRDGVTRMINLFKEYDIALSNCTVVEVREAVSSTFEVSY